MPTELTNQDLNREEQLTLSLDMKVKEIEQLNEKIETLETANGSLDYDLMKSRNTNSELRIEIKELKAKLSQANDTIEAFIDKLT